MYTFIAHTPLPGNAKKRSASGKTLQFFGFREEPDSHCPYAALVSRAKAMTMPSAAHLAAVLKGVVDKNRHSSSDREKAYAALRIASMPE